VDWKVNGEVSYMKTQMICKPILEEEQPTWPMGPISHVGEV